MELEVLDQAIANFENGEMEAETLLALLEMVQKIVL